MRRYPNIEDQDDQDNLKELNAKPWQVGLLKKNPSYVSWGNYEDSMSDKDAGRRSPMEFDSFNQLMADFHLDELNEVVNFYFELYRKNHQCPHCEGSGLNPATQKLSQDWYGFNDTEWVYINSDRRFNNKAWQYHLTQDEVFELLKHNRLNDLTDYRGIFVEETNTWISWDNGEKKETLPPRPDQIPTPEAVREWAKRGFGHDSINQWICLKVRAKRLGVYGNCEHCIDGYIYDEPTASVGLQLWVLHPRKGCSRGIYIKKIEKTDIPAVLTFLREAGERNANRFSKV